MRVYDWDPIRAEHYGQRPHRSHKQAAHMTAPDQCHRLASTRRKLLRQVGEFAAIRRASSRVSAGSLVRKLTKMDQRVFCRNLLRHILNFVRRVIPSISCRMFDTRKRDNKARNVVGVGEPINISAVGRLECDAQARLGHYGVKVACSWMLHRTSAWLCKSFSAPDEDRPNCVSQKAKSPNQEQTFL